jgi:hypothetical protein
MPRFTILEHDNPRGKHWDLMLEMGESLKTWALAVAPASNVEILCQSLPDHRLVYLDFEGPLAGDRGSVTRWDSGTFQFQQQGDTEYVVELSGDKLHGRAMLNKMPDDPSRWRFLLTVS